MNRIEDEDEKNRQRLYSVCLCPGEAVTTSRSTLRPSAPQQTMSDEQMVDDHFPALQFDFIWPIDFPQFHGVVWAHGGELQNFPKLAKSGFLKLIPGGTDRPTSHDGEDEPQMPFACRGSDVILRDYCSSKMISISTSSRSS